MYQIIRICKKRVRKMESNFESSIRVLKLNSNNKKSNRTKFDYEVSMQVIVQSQVNISNPNGNLNSYLGIEKQEITKKIVKLYTNTFWYEFRFGLDTDFIIRFRFEFYTYLNNSVRHLPFRTFFLHFIFFNVLWVQFINYIFTTYYLNHC